MATTSTVNSILLALSRATTFSTPIHTPPQQNLTFANLPAPLLCALKPLLVTLHFLFPHELLPALDILDRRLIRRLVLRDARAVEASAGEEGWEVFYVSSAPRSVASTSGPSAMHSARTGFRAATAGEDDSEPSAAAGARHKEYEVRLDSWNCSCAAFAQQLMRGLLLLDEGAGDGLVAEGEGSDGEGEGVGVGPFGGDERVVGKKGERSPVCKHILAAVLWKAAKGLWSGDGGVGVGVEVEEVAGWAAGWGE